MSLSLFRQISHSPAADVWRRFRASPEQMTRLVAAARGLGFPATDVPIPGSESERLIVVGDLSRIACIGETSRLSASPFRLTSESLSVFYTENEDVMRDLPDWIHRGKNECKPARKEESRSDVLPFMLILESEERTAWLEMERLLLHTIQGIGQLESEGEPLLVNVCAAIRELLTPDQLEIAFESPDDFWPGRTLGWTWVDAPGMSAPTSVALTPRLHRLLHKRERVLFIEDLDTAPDVQAGLPLVPSPFKSGFLLPLVSGAKPIGIAKLLYAQPLLPLAAEVEAVEVLRRDLSAFFGRHQTHLRMQRMATVDGLTNLFNHRFFRGQFRTEFQRAKRYHKMMSLIMIDIDDFKSFNDTYGHLAGDRVLAETARTIRNVVRDIDFVARYGGEEFALILPEVDAQGGLIVAEKIRRAVETQRLLSDEGEVIEGITVSCGVTDNIGANAPDEIIERADRALYWVKRHGRNLVRLAGEEE